MSNTMSIPENLIIKYITYTYSEYSYIYELK